jgi:predicted Zn-dependent peptidase
MDRAKRLMTEMEEKAYAAKTQGGLGGYANCETAQACDAEYRPGLRERVSSQLRDINRQEKKGLRLAELQHLLDKNPEVSRILDLLEEVRS